MLENEPVSVYLGSKRAFPLCTAESATKGNNTSQLSYM